ncbi:uncharacterized protein [Arachis hypogaea]|uniref:uncharacterized protein n=1 Tax=Arachis hypogaea TaxID=3818 RepID=UPI0007AF1434
MKKARENIEGSEREQYAELRDYILALLTANPGATINMDTTPMPDSLPIFKRLYICFDACKKGFIQGCRPFIGLDGTFLKGYYGGQLLTTVEQDANNQIFPIAYAVIDSEIRDNWRWFLELLHRDLGNYRVHGWKFMSDQQKGLIPAMEQVMPGVHHRFCAMHIWANFTKRWKDKQLKGAVWECCRATTVTEFEATMMRLKGINNAAWEYLDRLDPKTWTKAHFSEWPKVDNVTNNNCETFNGKILKYRGKPIITMLEKVIVHIMRVMARNKKSLSGYVGSVAPRQLSRLEREKEESNKWTPIWAGDDSGEIYEVEKHPTKVTVDLGNQKCTCRFWQLTGLPCRHACAALALRGRRPEDQIHNWLGMAAYNSAYQHNINPVPSKEFWDKAEGYPPLPPHYKTPIGRPTKKRRKEKNEAQLNSNPHKLKRRYETIICKYRGESGHNSRGCEKKHADMNDEVAAMEAEEAAAATNNPAQPPPPQQQNPNDAATAPRPKSKPMVSTETMNAASPAMRQRFEQFMPTPTLRHQPNPGPRPSKLVPRGVPGRSNDPATATDQVGPSEGGTMQGAATET